MNLKARMKIAGLDDVDLHVDGMVGVEALSRPYELEVTVLVEPDVELELRALEREAWLSLELEERSRVFHGIVRDVQMRGFHSVDDGSRVEARVSLVPRAWLMSERKCSRIFQGLRIDEVIRRVLAPYFIPSRWALVREYPQREYCTQYEETDLEFVQRLCAEAGIFFYFETPHDLPSGMGEGLAAGAAEALREVPGLDGQIGRLSSLLPGLVGGPREVMVFADTEHAYPPLSLEEGTSWASLVTAIAGGARQLLGQVPGGAQVSQGLDMLAGAGLGIAGEAPALHLRDLSGALQHPDERAVYAFHRKRVVRARRFSYREHDPDRPNATIASSHLAMGEGLAESVMDMGRAALQQALGGGSPLDGLGSAAQTGAQLGAQLGSQAASQAAGQLAGQVPGLGQIPGLGDMQGLVAPEQDLERYEHHRDFLFPDWDFQRAEAERMARAHRRDVDVAAAQSGCIWLEPGRRFRLEDHGLSRFNRPYVVTEIHHELTGHQHALPDTYKNRFECVPAEVAFVPERPERRHQHVCLTAEVQAHDESQIFTDRGARVKVRFHWDRAAVSGTSYNTCWIRVMQPWAGAGFGTLFIPRAGSEVVVSFEGGDPDRPLILGAVYNGANVPPAVLPDERTKTGIRTCSTPGGDGANELWFEDRSGQERIYLHAERDFDQQVEHDRHVEVAHDEHVQIGGQQELRVEGNVHHELLRDRETNVGGSERLRVEGDRTSHVGGATSEQVRGAREVQVTQGDRLEVGGSQQVVVRGDSLSRHGGNVTRVVGSSDSPRNAVTHVEGSVTTSATRAIELSAEESIILRCGDSAIRLTPDSVEVASPTIVLQGDGARLRLMSSTARIQADDRIQAVAEQVLLKASGAALGLSSEASVDGSRILLNSPESAQDSIEDEPVERTTIELTDQDGNPIPNQPYRIVMGDGSEVTGVLDEEGRAEIELDADGQIFFPGVSEVEEQ
ncbi:MAG: type VI secretion system tip protein VgrG [Myxococcales bacterium]|nr:type VI secretion system tip protein VgrG [Myxococcales bacterium]